MQIGSDVQAYDAQLDDIAGLTPTADNFIMGDGTNFGLVTGNAARTAFGAAGSGVNSDITSLTNLDDDSISGDKVSGGTIDTFASTGIDDNADALVITIDSDEQVGIGTITPGAALDVASASGIRAQQICDESGLNCKDISTGWGAGGSVTSVAMTTPTGLSVTGGPVTTSGTFSLGLTNDLAAVEDISGTGIAVRTGVDTWGTITDNSTNWDLAFTDRLKWDGGNTGLDAVAGRTSLGLQIGTDVQAYDAQLTDLAGLTPTADNFIMGDGSNFGLVTGGTARAALGAAASGVNNDITSLNNLDNDSISGDTISGGTIDTFASTGIDDNAAATAVTIDAAGQIGVGTVSPNSSLEVAGMVHSTTGGFKLPDGTIIDEVGDIGGSTTSALISNWPDAIICNTTIGSATYKTPHFLSAQRLANGTFTYRFIENGATYQVNFIASNGAYDSQTGWSSNDCTNKSISTLISEGRAKYFGNDIATITSDDDGDTKILVEKTSDEDAIRFDTAGSERAIIDAVGNLGLGTSTPNAALDVAGATGIRAEQICDELGSNCKDISTGWGGGGSVTSVGLTTPTGLSVTGGPVTTSGTFSLGLTNDLAAVEDLSGTGITVRTGTDTWGTITDNSTNWDLAFNDRLKWDGSNAGLDAAAGRTSLGLQIGTDVQAYDAQLDNIARLTPAADNFIMGDGSNFGLVTGSAARTALGAASTGANSDITSLNNLDNDSISGDTITGGTIDTFASTGIDDNAAATAVTIDATGQIGVGTTSPDTTLHVDGSIKIVDGNQGLGKILTSDVNGVATWQNGNSGGTGVVAWVKFDGATTNIAASYNVDSVTQISSGQYQINFSSPTGSADYALSGTCQTDIQSPHYNDGNECWISIPKGINSPLTTSSARIATRSNAGYYSNPPIVNVVFTGSGGVSGSNYWSGSGSNIYFNTGGKVGIGTLAPNAALDVAGATGIRAQQICDESGSNCKDISTGWGSGGSVTSVGLTTPTGLSVTGGPVTSSGTFSLGLTNDLAAVEDLSGTGIAIRTGVDTWSTTTDNSANWNLAYTYRLRWDGSATGLNVGTARTSLGLQIGSDVQAYDAQLDDLAGLTPTADNFVMGNGSNFGLASGSVARLSLGAAASGANADITSLTSLDDDSISGNIISGGTIDTFASTGIDDNAAATAMTIDATGQVGVGTLTPNSPLEVAGMVHSTVGGFKLPDGTILDEAGDIGGSTTSALIQDWPDAVVCNTTANGFNYKAPHFLSSQRPSANIAIYRFIYHASNFQVTYDLSTGAYNSQVGWDTNDCIGKSIATLISEGKAKYFGNDIATIASDDDGDTKIMVEKFSDEDAIRFDTGGNERAIIDAAGNVGIGTPTPNAALDVATATGIRAQQICDESGSNCKDLSAGWSLGEVASWKVQTKLSNYTVLDSEAGTLFLVSGASTITLPAAADLGSGKSIAIANADSDDVTIVTTGAETIADLPAIYLNESKDSVTLTSDGNNYYILGSKGKGITGRLVTVSGALQKQDGSALESCQAYLKDAHYDGQGTGNYWLDPDGPGGNAAFKASCDMDTDGGGWTLILNYVHDAGTNPALNIRTVDLPLMGSDTLGDDESGSANWGHAGNSMANNFEFETLRFQCRSSAHGKKIHFNSYSIPCNDYIKSGTGICSYMGRATVPLPGHTAFMPRDAIHATSNSGDLALTDNPFYNSGNYHWGIRAQGSRWECDDYVNNPNYDTIHRVWIR